MLKTKLKKICGFTLTEIMVYIGITSLILVLITHFSLDTLKERNLQLARTEVENEATFALDKISNSIENSVAVMHGLETDNDPDLSLFGTGTSAGRLILQDGEYNSVTINITRSGDAIYFQENNEPLIRLTRNTVRVKKLNFVAEEDEERGLIIPKSIQIIIELESTNPAVEYEKTFQTTVTLKNADFDGDKCPDNIDQYPHDSECCQDSDGDGVCDEQDNCPLISNSEQTDSDGDGIGTPCDTCEGCGEEGGGEEGETSGEGGIYYSENTIDSCIQNCSQYAEFGQILCEFFACGYVNQNGWYVNPESLNSTLETSEDNAGYAYNGIFGDKEIAEIYWKKIFILNTIPDHRIDEIDRFDFTFNYCHTRGTILFGLLPLPCYSGNYMEGTFEGTQDVELYNYDTSSWDKIGELLTRENSGEELTTEISYSSNLENYINDYKEVSVRMLFKSKGKKIWSFWLSNYSRFLLVDLLDLQVHVPASLCGNGIPSEGDEQCDDGSHCADGTECTSTGSSMCVGIGDEICRPRDNIGNQCSALCLNENAVCGNGLTEVDEECDDGGTEDNDGCNSSCKIERCGNGIKEGEEDCDLGKRCDFNGDYCTSDSECTSVGDGLCLMRSGDNDHCNAQCQTEECGNRILDIFDSVLEQCDNGSYCEDGTTECTTTGASVCSGIGGGTCAPRSGDGCSEICTFEECGNNIPDYEIGEECDDGSQCANGSGCTLDLQCSNVPGEDQTCQPRSGDGCSSSCQEEICGNHILDEGEECDQGKHCGDALHTRCEEDADCSGLGGEETCEVREHDGCNLACQSETPVCGNGILEFVENDAGIILDAEECDDGNLNDGDGCSHTCMQEYTASYNFSDTSKNGPGNHRQGWSIVIGINDLPLTSTGVSVAEDFAGTAPYQVEFNKIDEIIPQEITRSYYNVSLPDNNSFNLPFTKTNNYILQKFDFLVEENEFKSTESTPDRIEYMEVNWRGSRNAIGQDAYGVTYYPTVHLVIWNKSINTWEEIDTSHWIYFQNIQLVTTLEDSIENYIDTNRKIHLIVFTDESDNDYLNTDFVNLNLKAYGYREGY